MEIVDALESAGWKVAETNSGEEALALLHDGERFDLVVTDIRLHGAMTGWDVAAALRAANPDIGVIYASGNRRLPNGGSREASSSASPSASTT